MTGLQKAANVIAVVLCVAVSGYIVITGETTRALMREMHTKIARLSDVERLHMQDQLRASWTDADGVTHWVVTHQRDGETDEKFEARHDARVASRKAKHPPATPTGEAWHEEGR